MERVRDGGIGTTPIDRIRQLGPKIDQAMLSLTRLLEEIESRLDTLAPGVDVFLDDAVEEDEKIDEGVWLGFGSAECASGFIIESGSLENPERRERQLLRNAPANVLARAAGFLPELLAAVADSAEEKLKELSESVDAAKDLLSKFEDAQRSE